MSKLAGSLGAASSHPVSRALAQLVPEGERYAVDDVKETRGLGVTGRIAGERVALGRAELFRELGVAASPPPDHDGPIAASREGAAVPGLAAARRRAAAGGG